MKSFQPSSVPLPYQRLAFSMRESNPFSTVANHSGSASPRYFKNPYDKNSFFGTFIGKMTTKETKQDRQYYGWLSVQEVCLKLGISSSTFYKWRASQKAPRAKILPNGDLRIREDWFNDFMNELPEEVA